MLNLRLLVNIITIACLVLLQVLVFNKMTFQNLAAPSVYILFILFYPTNNNRFIFLTLCFLLGLGVDIFQDTGGINAFACVTIGFLRQYFIRLVSGVRFFEFEEFRFSDFKFGQWLIYLTILIFIYQFLVYFLESLSFELIRQVLLRTLYGSLFTLIFAIFYLVVFRKRIER